MLKPARQSGSLSIGQLEVEGVALVVSGFYATVNRPTPSLVESHLQTQRAAVKMLYDRILVLVQYVTDVIAGRSRAIHVLRVLIVL